MRQARDLSRAESPLPLQMLLARELLQAIGMELAAWVLPPPFDSAGA